MTDKQKEKLKKAILEGKVTDKTTLQVFSLVSDLEEKVNTVESTLKAEMETAVKNVKESEVSLDRVLTSIKGKDGISPADTHLVELIKPLIPEPIKGDNYILTEKDKAEIAKSVKVPIVKKIIEKTETVVEQPIINNEIKEVAKYEDRQKIIEKINTGKKSDTKIELGQIEGLEKSHLLLSDKIINRAIGIVDQRSSFLINKVSNLQAQVDAFNIAGAITLASVSGDSLTTANSLYTMTSGVDVNFKNTTGNSVLYISESSAGKVGINTSGSTFALANGLTIQGTTDPLEVRLDALGAVSANFTARRANGSVGSLTGVVSGDNLFTLRAMGYTSAGAFSNATALIKFAAAETFTSTALGTDIIWQTTAIGSTSRNQVFAIMNSGHVLLNGLSTDGTGILQFPAATTSAGGITFGTDTNLYRSAAGILSMNTNGQLFLRYLQGLGTNTYIDMVDASSGMKFYTGSSTLALTLDSSQLATFSGGITSTAAPIQATTIRVANINNQDNSITSIILANTTGLISIKKTFDQYSGIATAGWGVPAIYASARSTGQTGDVASVATYTCGAADGSFIVSCNANCTAFTAGVMAIQCAYTDETNTARTLVLSTSNITGTIGTSFAATGAFEGLPLHIRVKASTAITIKTVGTAFTGTYNVEGNVRQIA